MKCGVALAINNDKDLARFVAVVDENDVSGSSVDGADNRAWEDEVRLGDLIEPLGFDSIWAFEHHGTPYIQIPDPIQWLSFWAGRTERIGVGTQLIIVPWHHPVRLAEQLSLLQHMLGDREMYMGLGRGLGMREYAALGIDMQESRDRFTEGVEIVQELMRNEVVEYDGKFFKVPDTAQRTGGFSLRPRPADSARLLDSLYGGWFSPSSVDTIAGLGLKPIVLPSKSFNAYIADLQRFRELRSESGLPPVRPIVSVMLGYCGGTDAECEDVLQQNKALRKDPSKGLRGHESLEITYEFARGYHSKTPGYEFYGEKLKALAKQKRKPAPTEEGHYGTPDYHIKWMTELVQMLGADQVVVQFNGPGKLLPIEVEEKSMRLFAKEVLPAIHEFEVA